MNKRLAQSVIGAILVVAPVSGFAATAHAAQVGGVGGSSGQTSVFNSGFGEGFTDLNEGFALLNEGGFDLNHHDTGEGLIDIDQAFAQFTEASTDFFGSGSFGARFR